MYSLEICYAESKRKNRFIFLCCPDSWCSCLFNRPPFAEQPSNLAVPAKTLSVDVRRTCPGLYPVFNPWTFWACKNKIPCHNCRIIRFFMASPGSPPYCRFRALCGLVMALRTLALRPYLCLQPQSVTKYACLSG